VSIWEISIIAVTGFCSGVIKSGVGVGAGIFLLPTLSLAFSAKTALGLGAPLMLTSDVMALRYYWKQWIPLKEFARLLLAALPGLLAGTVLLPIMPAEGFRIAVGMFGMSYAFYHLFPKGRFALLLKSILANADQRLDGKQVYIFGALGGVATVLAHAGGIVWSLYLMTSVKDRRTFVGTIVLLFFITNIYKTVAYVAIDTVSMTEMMGVLPAIPAVLLGSAIGNVANKRMNQDIFRRLVLCVIFLVSAKLCF
jgi:Predicted permeases